MFFPCFFHGLSQETSTSCEVIWVLATCQQLRREAVPGSRELVDPDSVDETRISWDVASGNLLHSY
jgi:hypothetical protein